MSDAIRPTGDTNAERAERRDPTKATTEQRDTEKTTEQRDTGKATPFGSDRAIPAPREGDTTTPPPRESTARTERTEPSARPVHAPEPAPAVGSGNGSLLPHDENDKFSLRLQHAVTGFVDEPRSAVEEADHVLEEVATRLTEAVTKRRATLHGSWQSKGSDDTEQLRLALRDYRELTERLLHI
jgi:hypothetical protein